MHSHVLIVDVAPRDGLQNDPVCLSVTQKVELIERLLRAGLPRVEAGSFVNPQRVPQMADTDEVVRRLDPTDRQRCTGLIPNVRGYERAVAAGLRDVRAVVAASPTMNRKNVGCDPAETLAEIGQIAHRAHRDGVRLGAVIATAFGCPFEGYVPPTAVLALVSAVVAFGVHEIVLADTTGMAVPLQVVRLSNAVLEAVEGPKVMVGIHLHNTRNAGYANAVAAWQAGIRMFDAALGGIGGCPFAPNATGNIATEDLVHLFERSGITTGIDLPALLETSQWLVAQLGHPVPSLLPKAGPVAPEVYGVPPSP